MAGYRHYKNYGQGDDTVFLTTTCLDFAPLLMREQLRDQLVAKLFDDHAYYGATLHAYVVMSTHLHLVSKLPEGKDSGWFAQRIKSNSAKLLLPLLTVEEKQLIAHQQGLDGRQFWMRSYRAPILEREEVFWQKVDYVHQNPVKAELSEDAAAYRWSSAHLHEAGMWSDEFGLRR